MRRFIPLIALLLTLPALASPAHAADAPVISRSGLPAGVSFLTGSEIVPDPSLGDGTMTHVTGTAAATPPSGHGALSLVSSTDHQVAELRFAIGDPSSLIAFWSVLRETGGLSPDMWLRMTDGNVEYVGRFTMSLPSDAWSVDDAIAHTYAWYSVTDGNPPVPIGGASLQDFVTAHPTSTNLTVGIRQPSDGAVLVDTVRVSTGDPGTTYDFEAPSSTTSMVPSSTTITAGHSVTLRTVVREGSAPVTGEHVELWTRPAGASSWSKLTTLTTNSSGAAAATRTLQHTSAFQWRYAGTTSREPSVSPTATIGVRTRVALHLADTTLEPGAVLKALGTTNPTKPGTTVTLWRAKASGPVKLANATIASDGSFRLKHKVTRGTWKVYATVPATSGNLGGRSPVVRATVG
jgi:hypothetical protein